MAIASKRPQKPGTSSFCCVPDGRTAHGTCKWPSVVSAEIPLCARHILIAANDHKHLGGRYLTSVVITEEHQ
ncbi:hypothetical protein ACR5KS_03555 [Leucobacter sp. W1153]|uniref:hypothetical protein n=1 Tax=Leucobacter sp. W1153 TaxID=3439064 RepID=UPI003F3D660F